MLPDPKKWVRYLGLGMQIVATIALGMILGHFLDRWLDTERPWWTLAGATLGIVVALYQLFRDFS